MTAPFVVRINLTNAETTAHMKRVRKSMNSFFDYLKSVEYREINRLFKKATLYFCLGIAFIFLSFRLPVESFGGPRVLSDILAEGTTIAGWVSMWQAFAELIFELPPHIQTLGIYNKILDAKVLFSAQKD